MEHDHFGFHLLDSYASKITYAKYEKVDVRDVAQEQINLTKKNNVMTQKNY
jgi:hypothetical protein